MKGYLRLKILDFRFFLRAIEVEIWQYNNLNYGIDKKIFF